MPAPTSEPAPETISHIDSDAPPLDPIKAIEHTADDATDENEACAVQHAKVLSAPPTGPEDVVGPRITQPPDIAVEGAKKGLADDELPNASGPAAEALRFAPERSELPVVFEDTQAEDETNSQSRTEELSVERPELLPIPERSTAGTSRLNTEELEADSRKRKRRSGTPELPSQDIKAKKHRLSHDPAPEIHLKEDDDVVMEQAPLQESSEATEIKREHTIDGLSVSTETESTPGEPDTKREKKENVARYKNLVKSGADETPMEVITDNRPTVPALHPVTAALYIRNFMRPLRPEPLRAHLASLATPPSNSLDASLVKTLFLDAMKTHALVLFSSTTAASRVRALLHSSIWPPEGNRKELWVDFIPDDRVEDWIKEEEDAVIAEKKARASGQSTSPKRFEVVYADTEDGSTTATLQEIGSTAPSNAPRGPRASIDVQRLAAQQALPTPLVPKDARHDIEASFKTLDELFSSTVAKPQLFFLPVSDEISELRLKELDKETSRDWAPGEIRKGRGIKSEMKYKYSFDEEDRLVESGEDRGPWSEGYGGRGARGGGGFRGRGRGGGGHRGRGGDAWRG